MSREDNLCWFHGKVSRENAEQILREEATDDGVFLVRESNTAAGDYVLSVLHHGEVVHYQIRRLGEDAFFSIDELTTIHGLDTLIEYYQESSNGLVTKLTAVCKGDPPPHDSRRHGRTNLLHRATKEGNYTVVSELLKCGYRSLEAKNQDGQTAVHLASRMGKDDILKKLIESGANVNCRDTAGYTPLHYACQSNLPSTVRMLIQVGGASPQLRHCDTGHVPLHEGASRGLRDVVGALLVCHAPVRPRTVDNETPSDLAKKKGHLECARMLDDYETPAAKTNRSQWYHGTLDRNEAVIILKEYAATNHKHDGIFLIRYSDRNGGAYVLTMLQEGQPFHFIIRKKKCWLFIDDGPYLDSLEHLVEHYSLLPDGLPNTLQVSVPPKPKPALPEFSTMPRPNKLSPNRSKNSKSNDVSPQNLRKGSLPISPTSMHPTLQLRDSNIITANLSFSTNFIPILPPQDTYNIPMNNAAVSPDDNVIKSITVPNYNNNDKTNCNLNKNDINKATNQSINVNKLPSEQNMNTTCNISLIADANTTDLFIPKESLIIGAVLGEGEFGSVYKGFYDTPKGEQVDVAIKTLHQEHVEANRDEFLREANVMMGLNHHCIVRLIGISQGPPLLMVQELVPLGSMLSYLLEFPERVNPNYELKLWASQIACGMQYLETQKFVHRDLAARNILLSSRHQAKISDFGLSRALCSDNNYYQATQGGKWPIKWYAPESYNFGTFSHASDVWSFGVTLWEMFTMGDQPYGDRRGVDVIQMVEKGERLSKPDNCTPALYSLMLQCWSYTPKERPTFSKMTAILSSDPDYINIKELVKNTHIS